MPIDLTPGGFTVPVGPLSRSNEKNRIGVIEVTRSRFPQSWPSLLDTGRIWRPNRTLQITAAGTIGSGVLFTGPTPPSGWLEMAADPNGWLKGGVPRYALLGAFTDGGFPSNNDWFLIGAELGTQNAPLIWPMPVDPDNPFGAGDPARWLTFFLACNRPAEEGALSNGAGFWQVTLRIAELTPADAPRCAPPPARRSAACLSQLSALNSVRRNAEAACANVTAEKQAIDSARAVVAVAVGAWAFICTGLAAATGDNFFQASRDKTTMILKDLAAAAGTTTVAVAPGTALAASEATAAALSSAVVAGTGIVVGSALAKAAASVNWIVILAVGAACVVALAAAVAVIATVGAYLGHIRERERQVLEFHRQQLLYDQRLLGANRFCCASVVSADTTPRLLDRPNCGA